MNNLVDSTSPISNLNYIPFFFLWVNKQNILKALAKRHNNLNYIPWSLSNFNIFIFIRQVVRERIWNDQVSRHIGNLSGIANLAKHSQILVYHIPTILMQDMGKPLGTGTFSLPGWKITLLTFYSMKGWSDQIALSFEIGNPSNTSTL